MAHAGERGGASLDTGDESARDARSVEGGGTGGGPVRPFSLGNVCVYRDAPALTSTRGRPLPQPAPPPRVAGRCARPRGSAIRPRQTSA